VVDVYDVGAHSNGEQVWGGEGVSDHQRYLMLLGDLRHFLEGETAMSGFRGFSVYDLGIGRMAFSSSSDRSGLRKSTSMPMRGKV